MVDDAHGIGVLGKTGRGTAEHFGLEKEVDIIMGTYSKSLASIGGFVAASEEVIHYMKHTSRPLIFSASPPPASVAAVIAALDIIDREPERRERLWHNTNKMMKAFKQMGFDTGVCRNTHHTARHGRHGADVHDVEDPVRRRGVREPRGPPGNDSPADA